MKKTYICVFIALLIIYVALALLLPVDPQVLHKYGIGEMNARLLSLSIVLPFSLIFLTALYGFIRVKDYAEKVSNTTEGPYFKQLAIGLMIWAFSLPIKSIYSSLASYIKHAQPDLFPAASIIREYLSVILAVLAIMWIGRAARGLYNTLKLPAINNNVLYGLIGPVVLACVYTWLLVSEGQNNPGKGPYYTPEWLVVFTIAIPYIVTWCIGAWAAIQLYKYHKGVKGLLYKRAINDLAMGTAAIIGLSIILQFLTSLSGLLNRLDLSPFLAVIYLLVALYAVGYGMVARGAKKLKQIEEV